MPYADNDGVSLYYETDGPSEAETVVLVEGLGYGRWMWRWQRDRLAERYRVVVWDNRGTGDSDAPPSDARRASERSAETLDGAYTIAEMAGDLDAVLDAAGVDSAHVVGASMGGMIAQRYAIDYDRADSLGLLCTSPRGDDAVPTPPETRERMFDAPEEYDERETIRHKMAPAMTDEFAERNDDLIADIVDWRLASDADEDAREAQAAGVAAFDAGDRLGDIEVPALVAHGTADRVLPFENAELLDERLPRSELEPFEEGSHLFFIEQADAVNERLLAFLDDA
ncbi:alpha/beta fold hydrolase [Halomicrococcus sp. NG-SE-24]|uniref:alpha/beta fold hydrolase n=1 Tax=Halomicrococcus sp. NG-SE-24 TaxID=3436928 RepID=UPI003D98E922